MIPIQAAIDEYIASTRKEREPRISMSGLGNCMRKLILTERKAKHFDFDARNYRVFAMGFQVEEFVLKSLRAKGIVFKEQEAVEYRGITGTYDAILRDDESDALTLIDVKSVHSMKFNYLNKEGVDKNYAMQLWGYQKALEGKYKLSHIPRIFYVSKDDLRIEDLGVPRSDWGDKVDAKIDEIEKWRASDDLPPEKKERDWECFVCNKKSGTKAWCRYISNCPVMYKEYQDKGGKQ